MFENVSNMIPFSLTWSKHLIVHRIYKIKVKKFLFYFI